MTIERVDPAGGADELGALRGFLAFYRTTIRRQAAGLDAAQLAQPLPPSDLTLGGKLSHLASVEDYWFGEVLHGRAPIEPWASVDWAADADWDWHSAAGRSLDELDALLVGAIERSDAALDEALARDADLAQPALGGRAVGGETVTLRWILTHMVEEYARHAGHADLIRESIDGATDL